MERIIHPVLLCGGVGARLWPLSRRSFPKPFAELAGEESLFQAAARRLAGGGFAAPTAVAGNGFRFAVVEQLAALDLAPAHMLIEPAPKNTAAAVCAAALALEAHGPDTLMLVAPSDHLIPDAQRFRAAVAAAVPEAAVGRLVTFGIRPGRPETAYGWLELSEPPDAGFSPTPQRLQSFVEKPDPATAEKMLAGGKHLWNSGIYLFSTGAILKAFAACSPEVLAAARAAVEAARLDPPFTRLAAEPWGTLTSISIDQAVMERAGNLSVVPYAGSWSDLGDWQSVWRASASNGAGLAVSGPATAIDCENSLLRAESEAQELVGIGLRDMIAVAMPDAVLVAHRDSAQVVRQAVAALRYKGAAQVEAPPREQRAWGWREELAGGAGFSVQRIVIRPGASLPLQLRARGARHWIVLEGTAKVTVDGAVRRVAGRESAYIPAGAQHRLENPDDLPLTLIEVQTGADPGDAD